MALETKRIAVGSTAYTAIGTNVTALSANEYRVGNLRAYVVATGGTAPLVGSTDYVEFDGAFRHSGTAADIYIMSPNGPAFIGVVRE